MPISLFKAVCDVVIDLSRVLAMLERVPGLIPLLVAVSSRV